MDPKARQTLIETYKDGCRTVIEALQGISETELDARPAPGKWSAREIVHHLADTEMAAAIRLRRLIAEDRPAIQGYDQDEYARRLYYNRPIHSSLEAFRWARKTTAEILKRMTEAEWARAGTHSEIGRYPVDRWLEIYAEHAHKHADQIRLARAAAR